MTKNERPLITRRQAVVAGCSVGAAMAAPAIWAQGASAPRLLRTTIPVAKEAILSRALVVFGDEVTRETGGRYTFELLPSFDGGKLLDAKASVIPALLDGRVDILIETTSALTTLLQLPEMGLWDMPFLFRSYEEADFMLDGRVGHRILETVQSKGVTGLSYVDNGFRNITNNVRPIQTPEDLKNLRIRIVQSPIYKSTFEVLGAKPVMMPFNKLIPAIKAGEVDAGESPLYLIRDTKLYEVQKYLSIINYVYGAAAALISTKVWNSLSPQDKKIFSTAMQHARDFSRAEIRKANVESLQTLQAKGMTVNTVSPENIKRFENRLTRVSSSIASSVGLSVWADTINELNKYRQQKRR